MEEKETKITLKNKSINLDTISFSTEHFINDLWFNALMVYNLQYFFKRFILKARANLVKERL